jgi:hypothetical protein
MPTRGSALFQSNQTPTVWPVFFVAESTHWNSGRDDRNATEATLTLSAPKMGT